jgi:hypothetical protein
LTRGGRWVPAGIRRHPRAYGVLGAVAIIVATVVTCLVLVLVSSPAPVRPASRATATPAAPVPVARPAVTRAPLVSPFTGEPVARLGPVLAVKIDNLAPARPQTGVNAADIVYVLPVEGGLSRFMAVYSSHLPKVIGPVRSARQTDLPVLRQFGTPGFAYSGASPHFLPFIHRARLIDLYAGLPKSAGAYSRGTSRPAPHNLYARSATLLADARGSHRALSVAHDIGFRFGPAPASARGKPTARFSATYPAASFRFTWSARSKRWLVAMDGVPARDTTGGPLGAPTIVIQYTVVRASHFLAYGMPAPYAQSVGHGTAVVLRDGKACTVKWSRPNANVGTAYTTATGERMTFATGQVWVLLTAPPR